MKKHRDIRFRVLALTAVLISTVALLVQQLPDNERHVSSATASFNKAEHVTQHQQSEIARRFEQAVLMLHAEQYDYAIAALHRILEIAPTMPEAHVNMGFALLGSNNPEAAHDFFQSAIELRPTQANAYWGLAVSLELLCDLEGAMGAMRTYLHLAEPNEKFITRAKSALWEWETMTESDKPSEAVVAKNNKRLVTCKPMS